MLSYHRVPAEGAGRVPHGEPVVVLAGEHEVLGPCIVRTPASSTLRTRHHLEPKAMTPFLF